MSSLMRSNSITVERWDAAYQELSHASFSHGKSCPGARAARCVCVTGWLCGVWRRHVGELLSSLPGVVA